MKIKLTSCTPPLETQQNFDYYLELPKMTSVLKHFIDNVMEFLILSPSSELNFKRLLLPILTTHGAHKIVVKNMESLLMMPKKEHLFYP